MHIRALAVLTLFVCVFGPISSGANSATAKQQALAQWKELTSTNAVPPKVFIKGNEAQCYFEQNGNTVAFKADWRPDRVPSESYTVSRAKIRPSRRLSKLPANKRDGTEAIVLTGDEARKIGADLLERLTPRAAGHGVCYEALFADRVL